MERSLCSPCSFACAVPRKWFLSSSRYCVPRACAPLRKELLKNQSEKLFARERELAYCRKFVRGSGKFLLLTGPPNCGKTEILKQLVMEEAGVTWIDLRAGDCTTAEKFVYAVGAGLLDLDDPKAEFNWDPFTFSKETLRLSAYLEKRKAETGRVPTLIIECWTGQSKGPG